ETRQYLNGTRPCNPRSSIATVKGHLPVKTTIPPTVHRCATSRNLLDASTTRSALLTCAFWAAICACRNRRTLCSGVSPGIRGEGFGVAVAAPPALLDVA